MTCVANSKFGGVCCSVSPVVGGEDSTVVGISEWSPAGGERVGGCLQSECVSERQGTCYRMHPLN